MLLRRLSVFRGSWTLDAVQAVAGGEPLDRGGRASTCSAGWSTGRWSWSTGAGGQRYHLLETIREYAAERLAEAGEADRIARAHAGYLTDLAEQAEPELRGDGQARWLPRLAAERDDIDAALAWCTAHADTEPDAGLRLVGSLGWYWYFATSPDGGRQVAAMLAAAPGAPPRRGLGRCRRWPSRPGPERASCTRRRSARPPRRRAGSCSPSSATTFRTALSTTLLAVEAIGSERPRLPRSSC